MFVTSTLIVTAGFLVSIQATAPDFKACEHIKVAQLNGNHAACSSDDFTADCLAKFDAKGLDADCLGQFKFPDKMQGNTVKQLSEGEPKNLPLTIPFMRAFLNKHSDWDPSQTKKIVEHIAGNEEFMVSAFGDATFPKSLLARLVTADTGGILKPNVCAKFSADLARALADTALEKIQSSCLEAIPLDFFDGITPELLGNTNPKALRGITVPQVKKLQAKDVVKMKKEQAENWGVDPVVPVVDANATASVIAEQDKARKAYIEGHPCHYIMSWLGNVPAETKTAFQTHCKGVVVSSATALEASTVTLMLAVMAALAFMI